MVHRVAAFCYALLLRSFPSQERARYGQEMLDAFERERIAIARDRGVWSALRFVLVASVDVATAGWSERRREARRRNQYPKGGLMVGVGQDLKYAARGLTKSWFGAVAGVRSVSLADGVPLDYMRRNRRVSRAGEEADMWIQGTRATERYFETIATPILRGRVLESGDRVGAEPVAVITESLAQRLWPGEQAVGQRVRFAFDRSSSAEFAVVGVVADVAGSSHESDPTNIFVSLWQQPTKRITLVVRAASKDAAIARAIQDAVLRLDPDLTRPTVVTSRSIMEEQKAEIYSMSIFVGGLSALTLLLAALGVYGVVAFAVTNRTREIGVRMAMGASRLRVLTMVLSDGAKLALPGVVAGSLLAAVLAHFILERWYDYLDRATLDWAVLSLAAGAALTVVLLASSMPARRGASVQPMEALRRG